MITSPRQQFLSRRAALYQEQSTWRQLYRNLSDQVLPYRTRFLNSDRNRIARNDKIINSTPRRAARILSSGMMAGVTSPARPWFRVTTPDPALAEFGPVRAWLYQVETLIRTVYARSNIYNGLHTVYGDLGTYGTAALHLDSDDEDIIRGYPFPVGQYSLANSARLKVDTIYRDLSMTVGQMVELFGLAACSEPVQQMYKRGEVDTWQDIIHVIQPNKLYSYGELGPRGMKYVSVWIEAKAPESAGFLRVKGYHEFPVLAPRWDVLGEDVYGISPGMDALGDSQALQKLERRKLHLVDKTSSPPMAGPSSLLSRRPSLLAGDFTAVDVMTGGQKFEAAISIPPEAIRNVQESISEHERRINAIYYADLWLMLAESDRREITAREVAERHEEKMLQLGPVLERLQDELLDPLISRTFNILLRKGYVPEIPEELQGQELKVEYISILAQAQKLITTNAIERLAGYVTQLGTVRGDALDKIDWDESIDRYADALGVDPALVLSDDRVAQIRQARAQQEQRAQQLQALESASSSAKNLSQADLGGQNALAQLRQAYNPAEGAV